MAISRKIRPIQVATPLGDDGLLFFRLRRKFAQDAAHG
jgi:hypothetical protein